MMDFKFKVQRLAKYVTPLQNKSNNLSSVLIVCIIHISFTDKRVSSGGFDAADGSLPIAKGPYCFIKKSMEIHPLFNYTLSYQS